MKIQMKNYSWILMLSFFTLNVNILAQSSWNAAAPMNPLPLKYTSAHHGLKGLVKSVDEMLFNQEGLITEEAGVDEKIYTYTKSGIELSTNEYTFQYKYNESGQIVTLTIDEMQGITTYTYNEKGNLVSVLEIEGPNQMETLYFYDEQNRLVVKSVIYGEDTSSYRYDYYGEAGELEI